MSVTASTPAGPVSSAQSGTEASTTGRIPLPWETPDRKNSLAVFTLVLWLGCLLVGGLGFVLPYARPRPPAPPEEPVVAQQLQVELAQETVPPPDGEPPPPDPQAPAPPPDALAPPPIAQPIAVAQPSPVIAFALPVAGPTRVVEANRAEYARRPVANTNSAPPARPAAQPLSFGLGEGKQPEPEYPRAAVRQGQEGTVVVRLTVGEDGKVLTAEAAVPSPWPLLNEAALRAVRERWHFRSGPERAYEVSIRFKVKK